jgi:4,4'-diaponeurosporenoate glycosyltransferase
MTGIIIEFLIVLSGLVATAVLFYRFPKLTGVKDDKAQSPSVSVIIPARNEEVNLGLLLKDLSIQTLTPYEIICVDDASEDNTAGVVLSYGAKLISIQDKPDGWLGKAWACQNGADAAKGELLLFLDADVRLGKDGIKKLLGAYTKEGSTISVQPYHKTEKLYEQFSIMFNLVQIAANGVMLPKPLYIGLYGPVILIAQADYITVGGHKSVRKSIIEDVALGLEFKKAGLPFRLFIGDKDIAFRMYGSGLKSLLQGWIKNFATGASKTPLPVFLLVFLWITSITSVPIQLAKFAVLENMPWLAVYSILYIIWVLILTVLAGKVGRFKLWTLVFYPLLVLALLGVFTVSLIKKIFKLKVTWKGRAIATEEKP